MWQVISEWLKNQFLDNMFSTVFAVVVTWLYARQQVWRLRRMLKALERQRSGSEAVLIISAKSSIRQAVMQRFPEMSESQVFEVHRDGELLPDASDWQSFKSDIRAANKQIREGAFTRVHLFMQLPIALAVFAGSLLANGPEVVVYHYFNGCYKEVTRLRNDPE